MTQKINLTKILAIVLSVSLTCAVAFFMARAGSLNPASAPGDTMKTLDDIYCKIANCTPTTYGIDSPASATSTMHTLQEIYNIAFGGYYGKGWQANPSGDGSVALTQEICESSDGWAWFEDANGDGDENDAEDGLCAATSTVYSAVGSWNGMDYATWADNTYIAAYTCAGSFPSGYVATYSGINSVGAADTTWDNGDCALCQADCYDGKKDLPGQIGQDGGAYTGEALGITSHDGPITPEVLKNWKGTRLPTSSDFFGFCGATSGDADNTDGDSYYHSSGASSNKTIGDYGHNVGRGANGAPYDEYMDLSNISYEWLSEQHYNYNARVAGHFACSYFSNYNVYVGYRFRAVFRP